MHKKKTALFKNYTVKDGLSQNTVIRTLEDSKGYIWFCTRDGLNRFDGTEFEVYRADGSGKLTYQQRRDHHHGSRERRALDRFA